ncbi:hypothetical protein LMG27177_07216 [Paraburkholderia fynbosensis]|uniref:Uncharacterized protein n=1 Tax=Paraburkholderia fynbosensis TaxID=1200993 RepID=A0A6J5H2A5_9BURK|nr:hypothetical protein LMG27177_07216 [Paraburkholderia fynbosensis]
MQSACEAANESSVPGSTTHRSLACIVASIQNLAQIESAYGTATALTVRHVVYVTDRRIGAS